MIDKTPTQTTWVPQGDFYVTGGTLRPDAPSYVERQADRDLWDGLLKGEFCYVLTSRQMGKSSLMVRTVKRLRHEGVAVAVLDLTAIGQNLTIEQWYDGLISRLGQQLKLEDELFDFTSAHPEWGPLQRWISAIEEVVLKRIASRVVIFVDEIDIVRSLPFSTDEFFAAIRECYNRRSRDPAFARLAFGLLGVAAPTDLIRDTRMTPFNVGRRIELTDFTPSEAEPLARGLAAEDHAARGLLDRVLFWTGGHPYLTQRLCRALAESLQPDLSHESNVALPPRIPTPRTVDQLAEKLFLSRQARDRDDNLVFVRERILRSEVDVPGLLYLYRKVLCGDRVPDDETNPLVTVLRLAGIVRGVNGVLRVRNRVYSHVFDLRWTQTNMPDPEVRRQKRASRRGVLIGLAIAVVLVVGYLTIAPVWVRSRHARLAEATAWKIQSTYRDLNSYQDTFEMTMELAIGGVSVPVNGSGSIVYDKPDRMILGLKSGITTPDLDLRVARDGPIGWVHVPVKNECLFVPPGSMPRTFAIPPQIGPSLGPMQILPLYRLLLGAETAERFVHDAHNIRYEQEVELDGKPVIVIGWDQDPSAFLEPLGLTNAADNLRIPMTAWVSRSDHVVQQLRADFSTWGPQLLPGRPGVQLTGLIITETHKQITVSSSRAPRERFHLPPPPGCEPVQHLDLPVADISVLGTARREFARNIPPRLPAAPAEALDLSEYYNASLTKAWHPGSQENSLNALPPGLLQLQGHVFDVRGLVQLAGKNLNEWGGRYPQKITGIPVDQTCRHLYFLQACGWPAPVNRRVGTYVVHYADGHQQEIPIVYGQDVRDWNSDADPRTDLSRAVIAWTAMNDAKHRVRLFLATWLNPSPDVEVASIDYVSSMAESAPFLVAITADP